ncbi:MAG: alpha-L-fucosidase [Planctomycetaceae bacterium]
MPVTFGRLFPGKEVHLMATRKAGCVLKAAKHTVVVTAILLSVIPSANLWADHPRDPERRVTGNARQATTKPVSRGAVSGKKRWLEQAGYGLMFHYEVFSNHTSASYDKVIESFKVVPFADAVETTKAGYVIFTVGQHWGKFCAPNSAYERLLGVETGVWTSKRDLIMEIGRELQRRNIRLILYMTARAPMRHYKIIKAMGDALPTINGKPAGPGVNTMSHPRKVKGFRRSENQAPPPRFLKNWAAVCGEWSRRYGRLVSGWWFDGYKMEMKNAYQQLKQHEHNIDTWVTAVRSGNPDAELAFNAGAHPILSLCTRGKLCPHQTFTAGENRGFYQQTKKGRGKLLTPRNFPAPKGVVWHLLLPVSKGWGAGVKSRFDVQTLKDRIDLIDSQGGVVTLDVPVSPGGTIPREVLGVLQQLGRDIRKLKDGTRSF